MDPYPDLPKIQIGHNARCYASMPCQAAIVALFRSMILTINIEHNFIVLPVSTAACNGPSKSSYIAGSVFFTELQTFLFLHFLSYYWNLCLFLQPMLQELSKQNPQLLRLIQDHHAEFLQLLNEPVEGVEGLDFLFSIFFLSNIYTVKFWFSLFFFMIHKS